MFVICEYKYLIENSIKKLYGKLINRKNNVIEKYILPELNTFIHEVILMGLFSRNKKTKEPKWFINKKVGNFQLEDNYIRLTLALVNTESIIFYKDIQDIKKGKKFIKIKNKTEEYTISSPSSGCEPVIEEVYLQILNKVSDYK